MCEAGRDSPFPPPCPFILSILSAYPQGNSVRWTLHFPRLHLIHHHLYVDERSRTSWLPWGGQLYSVTFSPGYRPQTKGIKRPQMKISRTVSPDKLSLLRSFSLAFPYRTRKMVTSRQSFLLSLPNLRQTSASVPNLYTIFFACVILLKYTSSYKRPRSPHGTTSSRWFLYLKTVSYGWVCCFTLFLKLFKLLPWSCVWWWCLFSSPTSLWAPTAFRPERIPTKPWSIAH